MVLVVLKSRNLPQASSPTCRKLVSPQKCMLGIFKSQISSPGTHAVNNVLSNTTQASSKSCVPQTRKTEIRGEVLGWAGPTRTKFEI
jgi:hypothetical protein